MREQISPKAAPKEPPQTSAGAKTPAEPPEPTVKAVAAVFIKKKQMKPAMVSGPKSSNNSLAPAVKLA